MADNTVAIDIEVQVGDLESRLGKIETKLEEIGDKGEKAGKEVASGFQSAGEMAKTMPGPIGAAATAMSALRAGAMKFVVALKTVKGALMATGIGALVVAVGTLVAYFKNTERGAQTLRVATAALGAVMGALMDVVIGLGEGLVNLFTSPVDTIKSFAGTLKTYVIDNFNKILSGAGLLASSFKKLFAGDMAGALQDAKNGALELGDGILRLNPATGVIMALTEGAIDLGKEIAEDVKAATKLADAFNALKVSERELSVETARRRADIKELNKLAEDVTKSFAVRSEAAEKAGDLEDQLLQRRLANAAENVRIIKEQNALSESSEEDLQKLADAEIALANIRMESMELQTTIQNKLNTIKLQELALSEAERKAKEEQALADAQKELELLQQLQDSKVSLIESEREREREQEELDLERKLEKIVGDSEVEDQLRENLKEASRRKLQDIDDKYNKEALKSEQEARAAYVKLQEDKLTATSGVLGSIGQLLAASGNQSKEAVVLQKTIAVAQIAIDTAKAVVGAIAQAQSVPYPGNLIAMATGVAAVVAGIASAVATLNSSPMPGPSAASPPSASSAMASASAPSIDPVTTNTTDLGNAQGAQLAPIQAFVVETEMTGNQQNINQIENQVTFGIDG